MTDQDNTLHIPVLRVNLPCEECGTSPALQYELVGIKGVLCRSCLQEQVDKVNHVLKYHGDFIYDIPREE
jgi:hypothetical protein